MICKERRDRYDIRSRKMRIIAEIETYYFGHCLLGETDKAEYVPVGKGEDYTVNWKECEDFGKEE